MPRAGPARRQGAAHPPPGRIRARRRDQPSARLRSMKRGEKPWYSTILMAVTGCTNHRHAAVTITQVIDFHQLFIASFLSNSNESPEIGGLRPFRDKLPTKFSTDRVDGGTVVQRGLAGGKAGGRGGARSVFSFGG